MGHFTAKALHLKGNKTSKTEPAQHIITFPGGSVEVARCEDGTYWAHIARNRADDLSAWRDAAEQAIAEAEVRS